MPAHKRLTDQEIDALMQAFRSKRVRVAEFCAEKDIAVPTFKRWKKEWEVTTENREREARLATLPEKPLAWLPPDNLSGRKESPPSRDGLLTMMVDLADNLGPHSEQRVALHPPRRRDHKERRNRKQSAVLARQVERSQQLLDGMKAT